MLDIIHVTELCFAGIGNWYTFKINKLDIRTRTYTGHLV